jgi:F0F1-type ATP synthase membrane subunit c/vacuolar-type H+-ATPase subunit K
MEKGKSQLTGAYQTMVVIWAALLTSQFMLILVVFLTKRELFTFNFDAPAVNENMIVIAALGVVAVTSVGMSFVFRKKFRDQAIAEQKKELLQSGLIVAMALCEASSLFGLLLAFAFNYQYFFLWFMLGIVGMILHFPKFGDILSATYKHDSNNF